MIIDASPVARCHVLSRSLRRPSSLLPHSRAFASACRCNDSHQPSPLNSHSFVPRDAPNPVARHIAVLGGGVTGLTAAFELARTIPNAKITLCEGTNRLGGWIDSEVIPVDGGEVLFEWGPRSLRPALTGSGWATIHLISHLLASGKADSMLLIGAERSDPAAQNRFLYYPDHLVRMPVPPGTSPVTNIISNISTILQEPIFKGIPSGLLREPRLPGRDSSVRDESLGDFLARRFGSAVADNIASAVIHGIYAGDIYKLSARTVLPLLWYLEKRDPDNESIGLAMFEMLSRRKGISPYHDVAFRNLRPLDQFSPDASDVAKFMIRSMSSWSFYTWPQGLGYLSQSLQRNLEHLPNVTIQKNAAIKSLTYDRDRRKVCVIANDKKSHYDYVVSTLRPRTMETLLRSKDNNPKFTNSLDALAAVDKSVSVMVVNLYYSSANLLPGDLRGFGYLIPRSVSLDQNPERALGVIFGAQASGPRGEDAVQSAEATMAGQSMQGPIRVSEKTAKGGAQGEQDAPVRVGQDTVEGDKYTVMIGGHWWDAWSDEDYPSEKEAIEMAKNVMRRHLGIEEEPRIAKARLQRKCIPQHPVGYRDYLAKAHEGVLMDGFDGKLKVAGPFYQGKVGVNDCVRSAIEAAIFIREGWDDNTGLESYTRDEKWLLLDKDRGQYEIDPMC